MASATGAFATARDAVQSIGERLAALGPGVDAQLAALAARLGTLPAAARFAPFGELGAALAGGSAQASGGAAKKRGGGPRAAPAKSAAAGKTATVAAHAGPRFNAPAQGIGAALGGATAAGPSPEPDLAATLLAEPVLDAMATLARLTRKAPVDKSASVDSPLAWPAAIAQHVAQWMAEQLETAATPSLGFGSAPLGSVAADLLSSQELIERSLAGLGKPARHGAKTASAVPKRDDASNTPPPQSATEASASASAGQLAPRAPSKLLPHNATAPSPESPGVDRPLEPNSASDTDDDAIDAMTRALVDQAWLRGVDLR